jgi:arsenate reductase-like glutaredoxin family protein
MASAQLRMSTPNHKQGEALYIIILRDPQATNLLKKWAQDNRVTTAQIANNRMSLYSQHNLNQFTVTWKHDWDNITVWDVWLKRHIYLD